MAADGLVAAVAGVGLAVDADGFAGTAGLTVGIGLFGVLGDRAAAGNGDLRVGCGDPVGGNDDLVGTAVDFRGVGGTGDSFLRGDDLMVAAADVFGTGGGLPTGTAGCLPTADRSLVDDDNRCLPVGRRRSAGILGSDACLLSGSADGLVARDRPFSGVLKP